MPKLIDSQGLNKLKLDFKSTNKDNYITKTGIKK